MKDDAAAALLSLRGVKGVTERMLLKMLDAGDVDGLMSHPVRWYTACGVPEAVAERIVNRKINLDPGKRELATAAEKNIRIIFHCDEDYPAQLKNISAPPLTLSVYGDETALAKPMVAVVGARKASAAGEAFTRSLSRDLAEVGFTVVSGYARGIDINAHRGAAAGGSTAAVLGSGMLRLYPEDNRRYLKDMVKAGCIVSEFPLEEPPNNYNFPRRNRTISGMSLGVVVVEASERSGSLITARLAMEQNREVFAVPAFPGNINSSTNDLIRNGAKLVETYMDVVEEFAHLLPREKHVDKSNEPHIMNSNSPGHGLIHEHLARQPMSADELCALLGSSGLTPGAVITALGEMELDGAITRDTDGKFRINGALDG